MSRRKTNEEFLNQINNIYGNEYSILERYINDSTKILVRHNICGNEYYTTPNNLLRGSKCFKCYGSKKKTTEEFKKEVYSLVKDEYTILEEYTKNTNPILMRHNICGNEYYVRPVDFLKRNGNRCPKCSINIRAKKKTKTTEEFKKEVYSLVKDEYTVLEEYTGVHIKLLMRHNICGNEYYVEPNLFLNGNRCPKCNCMGISNAEKEVLKFIKSIYKGKIIENDKTILVNKELDIYIPELKLAIEYDGLYWHSDIKLDNNYHLNKTEECKDKGIQLIHIFEDEWINKKSIVKDKLRTLLKCNNVIDFKECIIKEISIKDKDSFLESNHIQGKDKSNINIGLYTNIKYYEEETLVAVMTFNNYNKHDYELSRFATLRYNSVLNSFDKLLKYFEKNYNYNMLKVNIDRRWSNGDLLIKNNFYLDRIVNPKYYYIDITSNNKKRIEILNENLLKENYHKIYDCGSYIFKKKRGN